MIKYLVFSGGGVRGFSFVGVLKALSDLDIAGCAGTSVGSIISTLVVIGYQYEELIEILRNKLCLHSMVSFNLLNILTNLGMDQGENIIKFITMLFEHKKIDPNITLRQLFYKTNKQLYIITTCVETQKCVYLHHTTHPDLSVLLAIRMSISLPGIFTPVKYEDNLYVDGSISNHFPINIFPKHEQLGFLLESQEDHRKSIKNILDYFGTIIQIMLKNIHIEQNGHTLIVPSSLDTLQFLCDFESLQKTISPVYESTLMWLEDERAHLSS